MVDKRIPRVILKDAKLIFRNFGGKEGPYNAAGERSFSVILPEEAATDMLADGWNVKELPPREEGDPVSYRIEVKVSYKIVAPQITQIVNGVRIPLGESEIEILDWGRVERADLIISPFSWTVNGRSGVKAYLHKLFITMEADELDDLYSDVPLGTTHAVENNYTDDSPFE